MSKKPTNPKDRMGIAKVPFSVIPGPVLGELGLALFEGARKYGRHNWRVAEALASVYFDASIRHLLDWYEGEDIDPDSGLSHITKAIASLTVLRDAMIQEKWVDDRPPPTKAGWLKRMNILAASIIERYPDCVEPWTAERVVGVLCSAPKCKALVVGHGQFCVQHTCCKVKCETGVHTSDPLCAEHEMKQCAWQDCGEITVDERCDYHAREPKYTCPGIACVVPVENCGDFCETCKQPF